VGIIPVKTPLAVKKLLPNYVWEIPTNDKILYLTFDDGPTPDMTNWTLDTLKEFNAKATFFCIGSNITKHPEIFKSIIANGHAIGNHTNTHIKGWNTSTKDYVSNVEETQEIINSKILNLHSPTVNLFRPPYGQIKPKQGNALMDLGYKIIMWHVLSFDWDKNVSQKTCLNNVISKSEPGSIIVFHDSVKASRNLKYVLPKVLEYFSKQGYVFKPIVF
jgi:peptidoglycan/xylan/chitin deacetylase (PgdA/CDA1 family)